MAEEPDVAELLFKHGADDSVVNGEGHTPIQSANEDEEKEEMLSYFATRAVKKEFGDDVEIKLSYKDEAGGDAAEAAPAGAGAGAAAAAVPAFEFPQGAGAAGGFKFT